MAAGYRQLSEFDYAGKNHKRECEQKRLATVAKTKGNAGHKNKFQDVRGCGVDRFQAAKTAE